MPYTQEELQELEFYQNLLSEDEERYLNQRNLHILRSRHSGSADLGTTFRDNDGTVLIFESPYTGEIFDDQSPENMVVASKISENLKNDITINDIIGRTFGEF
tara:strand:- start:1976 stop:2284 length:309 start_codon:yes stop_codon:yes gene_type:complete